MRFQTRSEKRSLGGRSVQESHGPSLKRKSTAPEVPSEGKRRRSAHDSEPYRQLLNEVIMQACGQNGSKEESRPLRASQIGASLWTSEEKEALFDALTVLGKDDIQRLAARVQTKSAVEVCHYLQLLQREMANRHLYDREIRLLSTVDMPAALELSQECCRVLDEEASRLEQQQNAMERAAEEEKWRESWLLTPARARWVEEKLAAGASGAEADEVWQEVPAAHLLKLQSWLELSERIFMNAAPPRAEDGNWRHMAADSAAPELPSIRATAFTDFANLAVSVTERLVQTTIFQAMGRCRGMDLKQLESGFSVKARDVRTACTVLGMPPNARDFWAKAGQRCGLHVYRKMSEMHPHPSADLRMTDAELEAALGERKPSGSRMASSLQDDQLDACSAKDDTAATRTFGQGTPTGCEITNRAALNARYTTPKMPTWKRSTG
ncbi:MAG: hypothetical protein M1826_006687 [Phylliscum demangeonii]|nr:MAG: hypothetical protein M1826_006687 [Phylliscum demangeonii]